MTLLKRWPTGVIYFTDCVLDGDDPGDAQARMSVGVRRELGLPVDGFVRVDYPGDGWDAAMTLVSLLHANEPTTTQEPRGNALILNNAAPRAETHRLTASRPQINGRQLCAFVLNGRSLVVSTYSLGFLSLAHRLGLITDLRLFDASEVLLGWAVSEKLMTTEQAGDMLRDPFRGATYIPWLASAILEFGFSAVPHSIDDLGEPTPAQGVVARLDTTAFGPNVYLDTLTSDLDVDWQSGRDSVRLWNGGGLPCYPSLAALPPGMLGAVPASSRFGPDRFVMVAVQGGSAYRTLLDRGLPVQVGIQVLHDSALKLATARA